VRKNTDKFKLGMYVKSSFTWYPPRGETSHLNEVQLYTASDMATLGSLQKT